MRMISAGGAAALTALSDEPRLRADDLMAAVGTLGLAAALAVARRFTLAEVVVDALLALGERSVDLAVAGNPGARLSNGAVAGLSQAAMVDAAVARALARRPDLDDRDAERTATLCALHDLVGGGREVDRDALEYAVMDALAADDADAAIVHLATAADAPRGAAAAGFCAPDPTPAMLLCRAAGFAWSTVRDLFALRTRLTGAPAPEQSELVALFEVTTREEARRAMRFVAASVAVRAVQGRMSPAFNSM
ncbi:MAG: DUF2336 domain-containing protein [Hyphomicrobiales bacterium]|nr:DUF2336 domain-containing protein [Hyphomicrobiales bacterium]